VGGGLLFIAGFVESAQLTTRLIHDIIITDNQYFLICKKV
jgi:hypothetical protein